MKLFISLVLLCVLSISCINTSSNLSKKEIDYIKSKYSSEVINYFYEINFYSEGLRRKKLQFCRWNKDVNIHVSGKYTNKDIEFIGDIVKTIDSLNLPIRLNIVDKVDPNGITILYGGIINNDANIGGICAIEDSNSVILNAEISIFESDRKVIEEELIQGLGLACDSYSHPYSLFYEGRNNNKSFTEIDKEVLKLLYEKVWPNNYNRIDFEHDFSDVLYSVNSSEKIKSYLSENKINSDVLDKIRKVCFTSKGILVKHSEDIGVRLLGDFKRNDSLQVINTIDAINKISNNLNLRVENFVDSVLSSGIDIRIVNVDNSEFTISNAETMGFATMFPKVINNTVTMKYNECLQSRDKINNSLTEAIYRCLVPLSPEDIRSKYKIMNDKVVFNEELVSILKFVYSDAFADAYKLTHFDVLIKEIQK